MPVIVVPELDGWDESNLAAESAVVNQWRTAHVLGATHGDEDVWLVPAQEDLGVRWSSGQCAAWVGHDGSGPGRPAQDDQGQIRDSYLSG